MYLTYLSVRPKKNKKKTTTRLSFSDGGTAIDYDKQFPSLLIKEAVGYLLSRHVGKTHLTSEGPKAEKLQFCSDGKETAERIICPAWHGGADDARLVPAESPVR